MGSPPRLRIATRQSRLALWQSEHAASQLRKADSGLEVDLLPMSTRGDEVLDRSLAQIGGKGLFLKELEHALLDRHADVAVHSLKDVPAESPDGLVLAAVLPRANWADLWLTRDGREPADLPEGSRVGTSSLRRQSQLLMNYPHLEVVPVRGNVETRLGRMSSGAVEAVVLAAAGIERLGLTPAHSRALLPPDFLPAPGQGVIVLQCRADDDRTRNRLAALECARTREQVDAERAVVKVLGADCRMPLAALAERRDGELFLAARLARPDGGDAIDVALSGPPDQAGELGRRVGERLLQLGAMSLLSRI